MPRVRVFSCCRPSAQISRASVREMIRCANCAGKSRWSPSRSFRTSFDMYSPSTERTTCLWVPSLWRRTRSAFSCFSSLSPSIPLELDAHRRQLFFALLAFDPPRLLADRARAAVHLLHPVDLDPAGRSPAYSRRPHVAVGGVSEEETGAILE